MEEIRRPLDRDAVLRMALTRDYRLAGQLDLFVANGWAHADDCFEALQLLAVWYLIKHYDAPTFMRLRARSTVMFGRNDSATIVEADTDSYGALILDALEIIDRIDVHSWSLDTDPESGYRKSYCSILLCQLIRASKELVEASCDRWRILKRIAHCCQCYRCSTGYFDLLQTRLIDLEAGDKISQENLLYLCKAVRDHFEWVRPDFTARARRADIDLDLDFQLYQSYAKALLSKLDISSLPAVLVPGSRELPSILQMAIDHLIYAARRHTLNRSYAYLGFVVYLLVDKGAFVGSWLSNNYYLTLTIVSVLANERRFSFGSQALNSICRCLNPWGCRDPLPSLRCLAAARITWPTSADCFTPSVSIARGSVRIPLAQFVRAHANFEVDRRASRLIYEMYGTYNSAKPS